MSRLPGMLGGDDRYGVGMYSTDGRRPAHPDGGLHRSTQGRPHRHQDPAHYRVRSDTIDSGGTITPRHNSRLHHIGVCANRRGTRVTVLIDDLHIRIIGRDTGQLIRDLTLDPKPGLPAGLPPGPPKKKR